MMVTMDITKHNHMQQQPKQEAQQEQEYQDYLGKLLEKGETALFSAYVALDWLHSKEFSESGLSAVEFITKQKEKFQ